VRTLSGVKRGCMFRATELRRGSRHERARVDVGRFS
jgi:hypothetical protein